MRSEASLQQQELELDFERRVRAWSKTHKSKRAKRACPSAVPAASIPTPPQEPSSDGVVVASPTEMEFDSVDLERAEVKIISATVLFNPKPHVRYTIQVSHAGRIFCTSKRFSQFIDLHLILESSVRTFKVKSPNKRIFKSLFPGGSLDPAFIRQRQLDLHKYLHNLMQNRRALNSDALRVFLSPVSDKDGSRVSDIATEMGDESSSVRSSVLQRPLAWLALLEGADMEPGLATFLRQKFQRWQDIHQPDAEIDLEEVRRQKDIFVSIWRLTDPSERAQFIDVESTPVLQQRATSMPSLVPSLVPLWRQWLAGWQNYSERSEVSTAVCGLLEEVLGVAHVFSLGWWRSVTRWDHALHQVAVATGVRSLQCCGNGLMDSAVTELAEQHLNEDLVALVVDKIVGVLWPDGVWYTPQPEPTQKEVADMVDSARTLVLRLLELPEAAPLVTVCGRRMLEETVELVFEVMDSPLLLTHVVFRLVDLLYLKLFPGAAKQNTPAIELEEEEEEEFQVELEEQPLLQDEYVHVAAPEVDVEEEDPEEDVTVPDADVDVAAASNS